MNKEDLSIGYALSDRVLKDLPTYREKIRSIREMIISNLILLGEIPAPSFDEERRIEVLMNRFNECGLHNPSVDEKLNAAGIWEGSEGHKNILITAHADTVHPIETDHTLSVHPDLVTGPGVADNSLGLAVLASLPDVLQVLDIKLKSNLILLGTTQSLGRGNIGGMRFFLDNAKLGIHAGICLEGAQLGRLSHMAVGLIRGEIVCKIPETYDWSRFGEASAILTINDLINKINEIPLPRRPRTSIQLGRIEGGVSLNKMASKARLGFEIRSESAAEVDKINDRLSELVAEVAMKTGDTLKLDVFAKRYPGGIPFSHPLVRSARAVMDKLEIDARYEPSTSDLTAFIDKGIPALTIGMTHGDALQSEEENIQIEPIFDGIAQLVAIIQAIDEGGYDED